MPTGNRELTPVAKHTLVERTMKISQRAKAVAPSATLAVTNRANELKKQGVDIVGFGAGEPDFDTPEYIKEAAIKALKGGKTKYTPAAGIIELRTAIAQKLEKDNGLKYTPEQIVVNIGGKHSVYEAMQAVLDPGDEVLLPAPFWVTYPEAAGLAGATVKILPGDKKNSYKITPAQLKNAITDKSALLVLNSPSNPGGFTYTPDELRGLAKVLEGTKVTVMSDEIYEKLIYGDTKFISFAALSEDAFNRTLTLNGLSKTYSMTGWRLGYTAGPLDVIKAMSRLQDHMTSNPVTFAQWAAIAAMGPEGAAAVEKMRRRVREARQVHGRPAQCHQRRGVPRADRCVLLFPRRLVLLRQDRRRHADHRQYGFLEGPPGAGQRRRRSRPALRLRCQRPPELCHVDGADHQRARPHGQMAPGIGWRRVTYLLAKSPANGYTYDSWWLEARRDVATRQLRSLRQGSDMVMNARDYGLVCVLATVVGVAVLCPIALANQDYPMGFSLNSLSSTLDLKRVLRLEGYHYVDRFQATSTIEGTLSWTKPPVSIQVYQIYVDGVEAGWRAGGATGYSGALRSEKFYFTCDSSGEMAARQWHQSITDAFLYTRHSLGLNAVCHTGGPVLCDSFEYRPPQVLRISYHVPGFSKVDASLEIIHEDGASEYLDKLDVHLPSTPSGTPQIVSILLDGDSGDPWELSVDARPLASTQEIEVQLRLVSGLSSPIVFETPVASELRLTLPGAPYDGAFGKQPLTIRQYDPCDPSRVFPMWDIRKAIAKNGGVLPLPNLLGTYVSDVPVARFLVSFTKTASEDINRDGQLDLRDFAVLASSWRQSAAPSLGDIAGPKGLGLPDGTRGYA